jgi:hypothetical protein
MWELVQVNGAAQHGEFLEFTHDGLSRAYGSPGSGNVGTAMRAWRLGESELVIEADLYPIQRLTSDWLVVQSGLLTFEFRRRR